MPIQKVILNTTEAREAFEAMAEQEIGGGHGGSEVVLSYEELSALQKGACIAFDNGEFSTFITLGLDALALSKS